MLNDSAQDIYRKSKARGLGFKRVDIQASGRTTIPRINYRNTKQILQTANLVAAKFLNPEEQDDDGVPVVRPVSCGREGDEPLIIRLPHASDEPGKIAEIVANAHKEGHAWGDMAVLCRKHTPMKLSDAIWLPPVFVTPETNKLMRLHVHAQFQHVVLPKETEGWTAVFGSARSC